MPSVAEVADEAGLAKGTVYLYFPSKEELLLALHERNVGGFFRALIALLDSASAVDVDERARADARATWSTRRCSCRSRRAASG